MQLPETQNAHHVHAFKKGYRLALEGKPLTHMPSAFRYDRTLRTFYEQGWSQANEELEAGYKASLEKPWRSRMAWFIVIVVGSIITAAGLINGVKKEQEEQQALILGLSSTTQSAPIQQVPTQQAPIQQKQPEAQAITLTNNSAYQTEVTGIPNRGGDDLSLIDKADKGLGTTAPLQQTDSALIREQSDQVLSATETSSKQDPSMTEQPVMQSALQPEEETLELSLLTSNQRDDLLLNQQEYQSQQTSSVVIKSIVASGIEIEQAVLTSKIKNKQPTDTLVDKVPKQIRNLSFFTQIKDAENRTIYHRWLFNNKEMALIPLEINSNLYRTWSSKKMASAWQGKWTVEVLNETKDVIYRQSFQYGNYK